jgi:predicted DNA-binding transcriptional regulator AlpA
MEPLLSPKELAATLGLAEQTIYNRHSTGGDLPPVLKLGRLLRFRASDVEAWLARQVVAAAPPPPQPAAPPRKRGRPTKAEQIAARRSAAPSSANRTVCVAPQAAAIGRSSNRENCHV